MGYQMMALPLRVNVKASIESRRIEASNCESIGVIVSAVVSSRDRERAIARVKVDLGWTCHGLIEFLRGSNGGM